MKTLQRRLQQAARDGGVGQIVVERDYAQTYVLLGIASQPELRKTLVFKGGTALKKVYFGSYRFSEDLDFSAVEGPMGAALESAVAAAVNAAQSSARQLAARGWVRPRGRDYFDLWHLVRLDPGRMNWAQVSEVLHAKCAYRDVAIASVADVFEPALLDEVRATWERTLGPFVPELPDVERVLAETQECLESLLKL